MRRLRAGRTSVTPATPATIAGRSTNPATFERLDDVTKTSVTPIPVTEIQALVVQ
jgi:hypothetical protein